MTNEMTEQSTTQISEYTILAKFEGEAIQENLVERIHIDNGEIVRLEKFENGEMVSSEEIETGGEVK